MTAETRQSHWENVYNTKGEREVSWFEDSPDLSLRLIEQAGVDATASIVDIGGGASRLVDALVDRRQAHVTVLDLSPAALLVARNRLGPTPGVDWVVSDVTTWVPARSYDLWHDRAAFHFLTRDEDRKTYVATMLKALRPGAVAVIGTFAPDGPEKCSGLPVARYDAEGLAAVLGDDFTLIAHRRHTHVTPWRAEQRFVFATFRRNQASPAPTS